MAQYTINYFAKSNDYRPAVKQFSFTVDSSSAENIGHSEDGQLWQSIYDTLLLEYVKRQTQINDAKAWQNGEKPYTMEEAEKYLKQQIYVALNSPKTLAAQLLEKERKARYTVKTFSEWVKNVFIVARSIYNNTTDGPELSEKAQETILRVFGQGRNMLQKDKEKLLDAVQQMADCGISEVLDCINCPETSEAIQWLADSIPAPDDSLKDMEI